MSSVIKTELFIILQLRFNKEKFVSLLYETKCAIMGRGATRTLLRGGLKNGKFLWRHFDDVI